MGYVYAALSGYSVNSLLENSFNNKTFLRHWLKRPGEIYPAVGISEQELRDYLKRIEDKLLFFEFGVRLSHFNRCDEGEYFLREFERAFPAREVFNNLGFCYLQQARKEMDSEQADLYWMPQILDAETLAYPLVMGKARLQTLKQAANSLSRKGKQLLEKAETVLKKAVKADLEYIPARINLAVTYLYLGKPYAAYRELKKTGKLRQTQANLYL